MMRPVHDIGSIGIYIEDCFDQDIIDKLISLSNEAKDKKFVRHASKVLIDSKDQRDLIKKVDETVINAIQLFFDKTNRNISDYIRYHNIEIEILTWKPNVNIGLHVDTVLYDDLEVVSPRPDMTILFYLSSDYEGGEIEFPDHSLKIKPQAGSIIIFKADTPHLVNAVSSGRRMTSMANLYLKSRKDIVQLDENRIN
jgi:predicted 2-oxoglutarate/Fe(II)-dependent dioxygenase YbiX